MKYSPLYPLAFSILCFGLIFLLPLLISDDHKVVRWQLICLLGVIGPVAGIISVHQSAKETKEIAAKVLIYFGYVAFGAWFCANLLLVFWGSILIRLG